MDRELFSLFILVDNIKDYNPNAFLTNYMILRDLSEEGTLQVFYAFIMTSLRISSDVIKILDQGRGTFLIFGKSHKGLKLFRA